MVNLINGKFYIGKDKYNNPNYLGSGKILKQALKKYGKINFIEEIIEECVDENYWLDREKYWIRYFDSIKNGYNIALGGCGGDTISNNPNKLIISKNHSEWMKTNNPTKGRKKSKDEIEKWKVSYVGKWKGENNPNYGKKHSDETKQKIRDANSLKPKTKEHKDKISENSPNNKICIIDNTKYRSVSYASKILNLPENTVRGRIKNKNFKNYKYE